MERIYLIVYFHLLIYLLMHLFTCVGRIAQSVYRLSYGLDGPESNPGGDEIFRNVQTGPGAHQASCKMGTGSFPGVKCGRGVLLTTHPLLVPSEPHRACNGTTLPLFIHCIVILLLVYLFNFIYFLSTHSIIY